MTMETHIVGRTFDDSGALRQIDNRLSDGWFVMHVSTVVYDGETSEHWTLRKANSENEGTPATSTPTQVRAIVSIECAESYSQSKQVYFKFWRCVLDNGDKVNIFDHPDVARNTFKIAEYQGWEHWQEMAVGEENHFFRPISVTVSYDGEWYSLVDMMRYDNHQNMSINEHEKQHAIEAEKPDAVDSFVANAVQEAATVFDIEDDENSDEA